MNDIQIGCNALMGPMLITHGYCQFNILPKKLFYCCQVQLIQSFLSYYHANNKISIVLMTCIIYCPPSALDAIFANIKIKIAHGDLGAGLLVCCKL